MGFSVITIFEIGQYITTYIFQGICNKLQRPDFCHCCKIPSASHKEQTTNHSPALAPEDTQNNHLEESADLVETIT